MKWTTKTYFINGSYLTIHRGDKPNIKKISKQEWIKQILAYKPDNLRYDEENNRMIEVIPKKKKKKRKKK